MKGKVLSILSEKNSNKIFIPGYDGPLLSFNLFNELQHDILPTETVEEAYKDYKAKFEKKRFQTFYVEHQNEEWFKEKYDPDLNLKIRAERNQQSQKLSEKFLEAIDKKEFEGLKLELKEKDETNKNFKIVNSGILKEDQANVEETSHNYYNDMDISGAPYFAFEPDRMTLFIHHLPKNVPRSTIYDEVKKQPGFITMSLSEPLKNQNYIRYCWITFDNELNCEYAYEALNDFKLTNDYKINLIKSKSNNIKKVRVCFPMFEDRIIEDLDLSKQLINILDKEKHIEVLSFLILRKTLYSMVRSLDQENINLIYKFYI